MELSAEDALRLNVLLANGPLAIRINESSMRVHGLLPNGEAAIDLKPTTSDEKYLKVVRAMLSEHALGSPGGYPLYLQRWTRMGRMRDESLHALLKLGDPTAVFAVVCAEGLTDELARRAWWAAEEPENARRMLQTKAVAKGNTGKKLARYLIEYLPFEVEPEKMIESVAMALQPGLLPEDIRFALWKKAGRKLPYLVGFIVANPDDLPDQLEAREDQGRFKPVLDELAAAGNPAAVVMDRVLSGSGQTLLATCLKILERPSSQEVVTRTFEVMRGYLGPLRNEDPDLSLDELENQAAEYCSRSATALELLHLAPSLGDELQTLYLLSGLGYGVIRPVLGGSTATGSLMRRKLEPVIGRLLIRINILLGRR
ncbi:MAG: sulfur reduction protein DsrS [Gammaproteobacteria bacterium]|nr:sulfur reduction protein DsrS [Gammaproteobacteria bacterium]